MSTSALAPHLAFFTYEARRNLPFVLASWALLAVPPIVSRLHTGSWLFIDQDWSELTGRTVLMLVTPLLATIMASSGWAQEREQRSLEWLYSRPLSSLQLYIIRVLTLLTALTTWALGCLLIHGISLAQAWKWQAESDQVFFFWHGLLIAGLGAGLLTAAVAANRSQALGLWILCALAAGAVATAPFYLVPSRRHLVPLCEPASLASTMNLSLWILGVGFFLVSAWIMRQAPSDNHWRQGLALATTVIVFGLLPGVAVVHLPSWGFASQSPSLQRDLGRGVKLQLIQARGLKKGIFHPVVQGSEKRQLNRRLFVLDDDLFTDRVSGQSMLREASQALFDRWHLLDSKGRSQAIEFTGPTLPIGWSKDRRRFAWRFFPSLGASPAQQQLAIREEDGSLNFLELAIDEPWAAVWIGKDALLLTSLKTEIDTEINWWKVISSRGEVIIDTTFLATPYQSLVIPSGSTYPSTGIRPRIDLQVHRNSSLPISQSGTSIFLVLRFKQKSQLVTIDLESRSLIHGPQIAARDPSVFQDFSESGLQEGSSLGQMVDGTLVWLNTALSPTGVRTMNAQTHVFSFDPLGSNPPAKVCAFDSSALTFFGLSGHFRGATSSGWAVWEDQFGISLEACHIATGRTQYTSFGRNLFTARGIGIAEQGLLVSTGLFPLPAN